MNLKVEKFYIPTVLVINMLFLLLSCSDSSSNEKSNSQQSNIDTTEIESIENIEKETLEIQDPVKSKIGMDLEALFTLIVDKNYQQAASGFLYKGSNEKRVNVSTFNPLESDELASVKITSEVIEKWITSADSYKIGTRSEVQDKYGVWQVQEVIFLSKNGLFSKYFWMKLIDDRYLIGDIKSQKPIS